MSCLETRDREYSHIISRINKYIEDDGWSTESMKEIVEEIQYRIVQSDKEALKRVKEANKMHIGEWII